MRIKLLYGDCLERMEKIPDNLIDMVLADVPYGTTRNKWDSIIPLEPMWKQLKRITKDNTAIVMTSAQPFTTTLIESNKKMFKYTWVWYKNIPTNFLNCRKQPLRTHEDVVIFYKKSPTYNPQMTKGESYISTSGANTSNYGLHKSVLTINNGERYPVDVIKFNTVRKGFHPAQKPVTMMEYLIKTYTNEGDIVLD